MNEQNQDITNNEVLCFLKEVKQFTCSVTSVLNDVNIICTQVQEELKPTDETPVDNKFNVGSTSAKLLVDIKKTADEIIPMMEGIYDQEYTQEFNLQLFEDYLEELESTKPNEMEIKKLFTAVSVGMKQLSWDSTSNKTDLNPKNIDSILAFSDFLEENPKVATSSPFFNKNVII